MAGGWRAASLVLILLSMPALALLAKMPSHPQILGVLNNAAHAPVFGVAAFVLVILLRRPPLDARLPRYLAAFAIAVLIGGLVEAVQPAFGRGAEWSDLLTDALGAAAGVTLAAWSESPPMPLWRRWPLLLLLTATAVPVLWPVAQSALGYRLRNNRFPTLYSAATARDQFFVRWHGVSVARVNLPNEWQRAGDSLSLQLRVTGGEWPRLHLHEPKPDWTSYSRLMLDVTNPDARPFDLTIRVHDREHNNVLADRFSRRVELTSRQRQLIAIPLEDVARGPRHRKLDLSRVAGLIMFCPGNEEQIGRTFYVTRVWLE